GGVHTLGQVRFVYPKAHQLEPWSENDGERRAPGAAADNCQILQDRRRLHPGAGDECGRWPSEKTCSVPARMRARFARCREIMKAPLMIEAATSESGGYIKIQTARGNMPPARTEPRDTWRVAATTPMNTIST